MDNVPRHNADTYARARHHLPRQSRLERFACSLYPLGPSWVSHSLVHHVLVMLSPARATHGAFRGA